MCQNNMMLESVLKEHEGTLEGMLDRLTLVDGVSVSELDQRLEKWVRFHNSTLMAATIQALRLPADLGRARTHLLYVALEQRGADEHAGQPGKFFRVRDAYVRRYRRAPDARHRESEKAKGIKRVDFLRDYRAFLGLAPVPAGLPAKGLAPGVVWALQVARA